MVDMIWPVMPVRLRANASPEPHSGQRSDQPRDAALRQEQRRGSAPRVAPNARRMPISDRRCVTAIANEL